MASIASPTWNEVLDMSADVLYAFTIVKGEQNGDEYLWDHWYSDPETGERVQGCWKSQAKKLNEVAHVAKPL